ncbi:MAG: hypothetical protein IKE64_06495, partial [Thermoguttaceae bacterium]|nr:hypothetical protein [Thermoguttaceae bacterium]
KMYSYRADRWEENLLDGVIALDEPLLGNLAKLSDKTIDSKLSLQHERHLWEFASPLKDLARNIRKGDIIIVRQGKTKVLGFGVVRATTITTKALAALSTAVRFSGRKKILPPSMTIIAMCWAAEAAR